MEERVKWKFKRMAFDRFDVPDFDSKIMASVLLNHINSIPTDTAHIHEKRVRIDPPNEFTVSGPHQVGLTTPSEAQAAYEKAKAWR